MRDYSLPCRTARLKGIHTPRFFVFFSGWLHARKGFIKVDEWGCMQSGFIKRKQEDFEYYSAKLMEQMDLADLQDYYEKGGQKHRELVEYVLQIDHFIDGLA